MYVTPSEAAAGAAETLARPSPTLARDLCPPPLRRTNARKLSGKGKRFHEPLAAHWCRWRDCPNDIRFRLTPDTGSTAKKLTAGRQYPEEMGQERLIEFDVISIFNSLCYWTAMKRSATVGANSRSDEDRCLDDVTL